MPPEAGPATAELLTKLDERITRYLGVQKEEFETRFKALKDVDGEVLGRLKLIDEGLESRDTAFTKLEREFNERRFNHGGGQFKERDALRAVLPDECKDWPSRIAQMRGGEFTAFSIEDDSGLMRPQIRSEQVARIAQTDPLLLACVAAWMRCRIKAFNATQDGDPSRAQKWNDQGRKLAEALGGFTAEARVALQEDSDSEGGALVPTIVETMIGWLMKDNSVVRASGPTVVQMTSKIHQFPNLLNDFTYTWFTEEGSFTDMAPTGPFGAGNLVAKKGGGIVTVSIELIQDSPTNLIDFLLVHLLSVRGRAEDIQMLEGDGSIFTGLFSASGVGSTASAGGTTPISMTEFLKLVYGGEHDTTIAPGVCYMHPWNVRDLLVSHAGTNNPYFLWSVELGKGTVAPDVLGGKRLYKTSAISRVRGGSNNQATGYHGNPAFLIVGDRMGTEFSVNPWSTAEYKAGQILCRLMNRTGYLVWVPQYFMKLTGIYTVA